MGIRKKMGINEARFATQLPVGQIPQNHNIEDRGYKWEIINIDL